MDENNPTGETLAGGAQLTPADGGAAVDSSTLTLAEMNQYLGKDFKDKESALKAVKETFSYVGKRKEDIAAEVRALSAPAPQTSPDSELKSQVQSLNDRLFFSENPEFKGYEAIIKKMGSDPAEVIGSEEFKKVFEQGKVATEVEQKRSVVSSSSRLAQSKSTVDNAIQIANARGTSGTDVAEALARGILRDED